MSSCCTSALPSSIQICSQCGKSCKNISMKTILHHVKFPDILDIETDSYYFCADKSCSVGYFSEEGKIISKKQLRVFTEPKHNKLCYCFDINIEQYIEALKDKTAITIKEFVIQKTKSGDCACEIRNPSGLCCLSYFKQLEKTLSTNE